MTDLVSIERRYKRELEQRAVALTQTGDLADLLSTTIFGSFRGDLEHLARIHTLLYAEIEDQSERVYRSAFARITSKDVEVGIAAEAIDRVLRSWSNALIHHSLRCVEKVSDRIVRSESPDFKRLSDKFSETISGLLDDTLEDVKNGTLRGMPLKDEREDRVMVNIHSSGTGNVINVAKYMADVRTSVTQNVNASAASDEIKSLMNALADEVAAIAQHIERDDAETLARNAEVLGKELNSPKPQKRWYQASLESIKEVAQAVGKIGGPILEIVSKLMPLLLS